MSELSPFQRAVANSLKRAQWFAVQALKGEPIRYCADQACRWADRQHYWAPDCGPR